MKRIKKLAALMMAAIMAFAMSATAFADSDYSITINNTNKGVSMVGNTYTAYKLFDVTYNDDKSAYAYTVADAFENFTYEDGENTYSGHELVEYLGKLESDSEALNKFAEAAYRHIGEHSVASAGSVEATNANTATISLDSAGYYLVYGSATAEGDKTVTAAVGLTTTNPNAEMNLKADAPTIDKVIVDADSTNGKGTAQDVGSTVNFKLTSKVPKMVGYDAYTYVVQDTMSSGLTFDKNVKVTIDGTSYEAFTVVTDGLEDGRTFEIQFTGSEFVKQTAGAEIVITYSATLNDKALETDVETNTVNLKYSNNPYTGGTGETPEKKVYVYDFDIEIDKYVDGKETDKLSDAKFVLRKAGTQDYYSVDNDKKVSWVTLNNIDQDSTEEEIEEAIKAAVEKGTITEVSTNNDGFASFAGLDSGKYELVETAAPDGYNKLSGPESVEIKATYDENGVIKEDPEETNTTKTEKNGIVKHIYTQKVANSTGSLLPSTGGIGTTIFYVVGAILVIGAGIVLVTKRRMTREQ